ncbi:hypothetical protein AQI88_30505 [Streptomyces cellostaticus]|uniref:Low molecular weight protein antigen 6 PH domain-containing protein n=1 Tax=Streptomyces cellostaticus TaxID=67285 RepID=A0A101NGR4_9ACTN|nr:PH domain-containing protein [Streptomyces cellostaticus]KUM92714.1 hypothetical protein AQI88_30505 [Streptomyces cellostaticus]GHI06681.1 hypothetical protein Scel_50020 [Streptomyces cellostaticus]
MDEGGLVREYRKRRRRPGQVLILPVILLGNAVLQTVRPHDGMPGWWAPTALGLLLAACVWRALLEWRARTWVTAEGITRQGPVRLRSWAWSDIYDIRLEHGGGDAVNAAPRWPAYVYDHEGRRFRIPHLDEMQLDDPYAEVAALRHAAWQHGWSSWEQRPEVEERILRRAGQRKGWRWASIGAVIVLAAMAVVAVAEAAVGTPVDLLLQLVGVPLAAFAVLGIALSTYWATHHPRPQNRPW